MAKSDHSENDQRTTLVLDLEELRRAQEILGTKTTRETVNGALHEVNRIAALRRAAAMVRRGDLGVVEPGDLPELRRTRSV
ncbi:MAG: type II toxin-antitoxin system VapB family antitoxin [Acidimicrobiales bacterium]